MKTIDKINSNLKMDGIESDIVNQINNEFKFVYKSNFVSKEILYSSLSILKFSSILWSSKNIKKDEISTRQEAGLVCLYLAAADDAQFASTCPEPFSDLCIAGTAIYSAASFKGYKEGH